MNSRNANFAVFAIAIFTLAGCAAHTPEVESSSASSTLKDARNRYRAANLIDGTSASWCEGSAGPGTGVVLTVKLAARAKVKVLHVRNGFGDPRYFAKNNRVRELLIKSEHGSALVRLKDSPDTQIIPIAPAVTGTAIKVEIKSVYRGSKFNDTCIAELGFTPLKLKVVDKPAGASETAGGSKQCACVYWMNWTAFSAKGKSNPNSFDDSCVMSKCLEDDMMLKKCHRGTTCARLGYTYNCRIFESNFLIQSEDACVQ